MVVAVVVMVVVVLLVAVVVVVGATFASVRVCRDDDGSGEVRAVGWAGSDGRGGGVKVLATVCGDEDCGGSGGRGCD